MTLRVSLRSRPVIYEIVPPRRDTSRFGTELRGAEDVLKDGRIAAINIPELTNRRVENGATVYSPATIPPEDYALMIRDLKEPMVNIVAPRQEESTFVARARRILLSYRIPNIVIVGKEKATDELPGPDVARALRLLSDDKPESCSLGGICIFSRASSGTDEKGERVSTLAEPRRVWLKGLAGCDFVTSQIVFEAGPALKFLVSYQRLCRETGRDPLTVFVSLATVPTPSILALLESLDVSIPSRTKKRLAGSSDMGRESVKIASEAIQDLLVGAEREGIEVPLGLQVEQVGVNNGDLSLRLLDSVHPLFK